MILDGKEFFACDIADPLGIAADVAFSRYLDQDDPAWLSAHVNLVSVKTKVNSQCTREANDTSGAAPETIKRGHPLFSEVQRALAPVANDASVVNAINKLADDTGALAGGPTWLRPALVAGGLATVAYLGWSWAYGGSAKRRRRRFF